MLALQNGFEQDKAKVKESHTPVALTRASRRTRLGGAPLKRIVSSDFMQGCLFQDNEIEDAWAVEVKRRIKKIEAGRAQLIPATDAIARARGVVFRT